MYLDHEGNHNQYKAELDISKTEPNLSVSANEWKKHWNIFGI